MTPDEIVKALRCCGLYDYDKNCGECPVCAKEKVYCSDVMPHAADLIESLQTQLADYHHMSELVDGKMVENQRLRRINENLQSQLAASQRETRAAVEELNVLHDRIGGELPKRCKDCELWGKAGWGQYGIGYCEGDDRPHKGSDFCNRWRGPQEAGEGGQDGD